MIQIIALYQPIGAPWYYVPLNVFLFLIALSFPFVVRFVILRRPVINLWAAIPLSFLFGLIIDLFLYNLFPIKLTVPLHTPIYRNFSLLLFGVACIYSYWIMHIGYRSYCIQKFIENNTEDEPKEEIMNWKRGIRRIVFVLAGVAAGISVGLVVSQIHLLLQEEKGFWANLSLSGPVILYGLYGVSGLVAGTFGFVSVWLIYGLLEWLVPSFCDNNRLQLAIRRLTGLLIFIVQVVTRVFHNCSAMNKKHKIIWIGIAVVVLMCLFPPWIRVVEFEGSRAYRSVGYHFLLAPPKSKGIESFSIDLGRLIMQCVIVSLITGGLLCTLRTEQSNRE